MAHGALRGSLKVGCGAAALVLAGCQGVNLSPNPGPGVQLDTLRPTADFYARVDRPIENSSPSLLGNSRENWASMEFLVPVAGVEHKPLYMGDKPRRTDSTARQRGEYPTQASATEGSDGRSTVRQTYEALWAPLRATWDMVMFVPRMFVAPPWRTVSSPRDGYARGPHQTLKGNGGLRGSELGVTLMPLSGEVPVGPASDPGPVSASPNTEPAPVAGEAGAPVTVPNPAGAEPAPSRTPGGAIGGSDSPRRRGQRTPEQKP